MDMEYIFSNYGIEIVVGMIISVLVFIFLRVLYFGYIKKESKNTIGTIKENKTLDGENSEKDEQLRDKIIDLFDGEILT